MVSNTMATQLQTTLHIHIYIMFDVFKHHCKMLKGRKLHLNIIFFTVYRIWLHHCCHAPTSYFGHTSVSNLCFTCTSISNWPTFIWNEATLSFTQHTCMLCPLRGIKLTLTFDCLGQFTSNKNCYVSFSILFLFICTEM